VYADGPKGNEFAKAGVGENNVDSPLHPGDGLVKTIKVGHFGNYIIHTNTLTENLADIHQATDMRWGRAGGGMLDDRPCPAEGTCTAPAPK
jgi:hypothetical protein